MESLDWFQEESSASTSTARLPLLQLAWGLEEPLQAAERSFSHKREGVVSFAGMSVMMAAIRGAATFGNATAFTTRSFLECELRTTRRVRCARVEVERRVTSALLTTRSQHSSERVKCQAVKTASPIPPLVQLTTEEPKPLLKFVKAFAPATVANLGPGYDFLGCAVEGMGDYVSAEVDENVAPGKVAIASITGDDSRLSLVADKNCAGIAGQATMTLLGVQNVGVTLKLHKGLPLGSGLGSSAASAAAAAVAVNSLFGSPLSKAQLVQAGLESEATVSGYHADNVAPSLMGGFVLVRSYDPLHLIPLEFPEEKQLYFVLVIPEFEAPTKEMRAVLSPEISMKAHVENCSQAAALVSAILLGDAKLLGSSLGSDTIVEPKRGPLIPGMLAVKLVSMRHGAFGCTISGAGPTTVAITDSEEEGHRIGARMVEEFMADGQLMAAAHVQKLDREGARVVESQKL